MKNIITPLLTILLSSLTSCKDGLNFLNFRSEQNESFYEGNNYDASNRLMKIMYNQTDSGKYERFKIVHISDPHLSSWSLSNNYKLPINLIQSVHFANQPELRINSITVTGDFISISDKNKAKEYMSSFVHNLYEGNNIPTFICTGNHDSNSKETLGNTFLYKNEINKLLFKTQNYHLRKEEQENYYYSDVPNPQGGMIRFIALDMLDQSGEEYNTLKYAIFSQKQIDWFTHVALKEGITPHHSVIILTHYPFEPYSFGGTETYLCDGDFVHTWNMIPEIVEAFRTSTSLKKVYPNLLKKEPITVNVDYKNNESDFVCYLGGHVHSNVNFEITGLENASTNLPAQKMIICTNQAPSEKGTIYNRVEREEDSPSSNSFCIHSIDTKEKIIYTTYFGAFKPSNNSNFPEINKIKYK